MLNPEQISPQKPSHALPPAFAGWFERRGWVLRDHQKALIERADEGRSTLLTAPTGAGKTLAGFLPSLIELSGGEKPFRGLHTLYLSPLKALAVDISRNLMQPVDELGLEISIETRTGDTPSHKKQRQRRSPPNILLTTPEQ
ncbi:MAG: DEAD/DEAH box helicase, partial [Alphaproteobacteria bacterium]|nr:DEAD/DEAH box helicase [Alphaproteobacteria bacterium]